MKTPLVLLFVVCGLLGALLPDERATLPIENDLAHVDTAAVYVGTREVGNNGGPVVDRFLGAVGLAGSRAPWCAAFISYALQQAEAGTHRSVVSPTERGAVATRYIVSRGRLEGTTSLDARDVLQGRATVAAGSLVIWRRGASWQGHIGVVEHWDGACGTTVEGNTSAGAGSQRDGDGVWRRRRCITPTSSFRIVAFTPVHYAS